MGTILGGWNMGSGIIWLLVQVDDNDDYNGLFLVLYDELFFSKSKENYEI